MLTQRNGAALAGHPSTEPTPPGVVHLPPIIHQGQQNVKWPATYPAVIIISRPATRATPEPKVIIDNRVLLDAVDLEERMQMFSTVDHAYHTVGLYAYTPVPADEVVDVADALRREMYQAECGDSHEDQDTRHAAARGMA